MNKNSNFEIFSDFFEQFENTARELGYSIDRKILLGRKKDLISLAKKFNIKLSTLSEASFEEYLRKLGCKFPSPQVSKSDDRIKLSIGPRLLAKTSMRMQ
jgi:hypothetical protein